LRERRALMVCPEAPYPLHGGGALRTAGLLHYLAGRYTVEAIFFREAGDVDPREALPPGLVSESALIDLPLHSRGLAARAARNLRRLGRGAPPLNERFGGYEEAIRRLVGNKRYDVCVVEHFWCAPYHEALREHCDSMVLDLHNIESVLYRRRAAISGWPLRAALERFAECSSRLERHWLPRYQLTIAASDRDAALANRIAPGARIAVYPNTIPWREEPRAALERRVVFSGNFGYDPNRAAAAWLIEKVWPLVAARDPTLELVLVGRNPGGVAALAKRAPRVRVTGPVEDAGQEIAQALVAVAPIRSGSGTRIKILEAWAAKVPIVTTAIGGEGLPGVEGKHWLMRDDAVSFAEAVSLLSESVSLREQMGTSGRALYESEFTWECGWKLLETLGI
jgi:glycosyltransferase involved in cell wall biosynthesis